MTMSAWQPCPSRLDDDDRFLGAIVGLHEELFARHFATEPRVNPDLGIQVHAFRRIEKWRLVLVLTPWMLSRLLVPSADPGIEIPRAWRVENRIGADYVLLGPKVSFDLLQPQTANLNFHPVLGHYLLQPIVLSMSGYKSPSEVFQAWNQVIKTRDENMAKRRNDCPWQKEVSRREFFGRFKKGSSQEQP